MAGEEALRRYLIRRPKALQYFHNGVLKREYESERSSGRFELFLDLLCMTAMVAIVANFADGLAEDSTGVGLVKYILIFTPAWHAWTEIKELSNKYYNDDIFQRTLTLWLMVLLVLYGNNATHVEDINDLRMTVGVYLVARLSCILTYALYSIPSRPHRLQNIVYSSLVLLSMFVWVPLFFDSLSIRAKIAVAAVAIIVEEMTWVFSFSPLLKRILKETYSTAVDIPHEVDRAAAFYTIVLGEFLYYIIVRSPAAGGLTLPALRAVWTLVIAFCLNWLYDNDDGAIEHTHPLRRSIYSAFIWLLIHLPLAAGLLIGGHICALSVAEEELGSGKRWLWGGGLGVGMLVLFIIALCFKDDDPKGTLLMPKAGRMIPRLLAAVIFALLPLTSEEQLNATELLSVGAGIVVFVTIWETVTSLEKGACTFESWRGPEILMSEQTDMNGENGEELVGKNENDSV